MNSASRITTPFTRESTTEDVLRGVDLTGKRVIVTGGASGIGVETARALASAGAEVTLAVRDVSAGERTAHEITEKTGNRNVFVGELDLLDARSIASFAAAWEGPLHVLVNNAGIMALPERHLTPEGWELQFATNHLGHFALTLALHDALAAAGAARIVMLSSSAHRVSPIHFDDINFENRAYDEWLAYGQAKTANVLFAVEATKRWAQDGITANALMPGGIHTGLQRHQTSPEYLELVKDYPWKTLEQGASTSVLLAASPLVEGVGGRYFEDNNEAELTDDPEQQAGVHPHALDSASAARLWDVSVEMLAQRSAA